MLLVIALLVILSAGAVCRDNETDLGNCPSLSSSLPAAAPFVTDAAPRVPVIVHPLPDIVPRLPDFGPRLPVWRRYVANLARMQSVLAGAGSAPRERHGDSLIETMLRQFAITAIVYVNARRNYSEHCRRICEDNLACFKERASNTYKIGHDFHQRHFFFL